MNRYILRMKTITGLGTEYVNVFANINFERYLNIHKLEYKRDFSQNYEILNSELQQKIKPSFTTRKLKELEQENKQLKEIIEEIKNIDIFKEFTFPLMKRWEEQQVLSSIDYQFKNTFIKKINELEKGENNE